jgi:excisionase family DNA binding protein
MEQMLTVGEVSRLLAVCHETVRRMAKRGALRGSKLAGGRDWRFRNSDVDSYVKKCASRTSCVAQAQGQEVGK